MSTSRTRLCCLIGDPVEHSFSPKMFSAVFSKLNLDYTYLAFRVKAEDLGAALKGLRVMGFVGCNVTIPHKIEVVKYLDASDRTAELSGSVNVVANRGGMLIGYNTDGAGVLASLEFAGVELNNQRILILGYGGAARAVAFEFATKKRAAELLISGRNPTKAWNLAQAVGGMVKARAVALDGDLEKEDINVIVNATPVGMYPRINECPIPDKLLRQEITVLDLVYNPVETALLRLAKAKGGKVINGLETLVQQGARTFSIWTDQEAPLEAMRQAVMEVLK